MSAEDHLIIDIVNVRVLARYVVELTFEDGAVKVVDLEPMLWGPMFVPILADYEAFVRVRADPSAGTIVWPNGADLSPTALYRAAKASVPTSS